MSENERRSPDAAKGFRYSVSYSKRDWPFRPWRWKRIRESRFIEFKGAKS